MGKQEANIRQCDRRSKIPLEVIWEKRMKEIRGVAEGNNN